MPHLLNLELQTGADSDLPRRIVRYHNELHTQSGLPVISMILYSFETAVQVPPYTVEIIKAPDEAAALRLLVSCGRQ